MKNPRESSRTPRVRSLGHGRTVRRALARGGTGPARALNTALGGWDRVRITPMFGRWGYFVGERLFACFPLRDKDHDLWVRLTPEDQARALREPGVRPHRRFARQGWVEILVPGEAEVDGALRWLRRAWRAAASAPPGEGP
jgi:predicted DNA-binding protein (MmcQ/YjbR family)